MSAGSSHQFIVVFFTIGVGWLMLFAGIGKKRLAWRPPSTCRRCNRPAESCSCPAHHH